MDYLKRLQTEVDNILALCDEAAALQRKLTAAINRIESLELERQGFYPVSLKDLRENDGINYLSLDDFIRQTGPYEPVRWSGFDEPRQVSGQLSGRAGAAARYNKKIGFEDGYDLLLNCLVAAHHIDPTSITPPDTIPAWQQIEYQRLLSIDYARAHLSLNLPMPHEVEEGAYCIRVRTLLITAINARLEHTPIDVRPKASEISELVNTQFGNNKLLRLLKTGYRSTSDWYRRNQG